MRRAKKLAMFALMIMFIMPANLKVYAAAPKETIFTGMNAERTKAGVNTLVFDRALSEAANIRAKEAAVLFSHTRPDGTDYYTVDPSSVYAENLSYGTQEQMGHVVEAFMLSQSHKANVLDSGLTKVGIGVYQVGNVYYIAVEFG